MRQFASAVQMSFLLHASAVALVFLIGNSVRHEKKPLVINVILENTRVEKTLPESAEREKASRSATGALPRPLKKLSKPTIETKVASVLQKTRETTAEETKPQAVTVVPAQQISGNESVKNSATGAPVQGMARGTGGTNSAGSASQGTGEDGSSSGVEQAKRRYLKEHFAYIRDLISKNLSYPAMAREMGWSGKVTVSFVVREDGNVEELKVLKSSGFEILDKNTLDSIIKTAPFPRPPVKAELVMPFVYKLE